MSLILATAKRLRFQALGASNRLLGCVSNARLSTEASSPEGPEKAREKESEIDMFAAAIEGTPEANSYPLWLKKIHERLAVGSGPVFLGGRTPFPYNPEFRPRPPLSDSFQNLVFSVWVGEPTKWTPRQLSIRFKISIERVKAIIKLKLLQRKMEAEGFQVPSEYVESMERHLGASEPRSAEMDSTNDRRAIAHNIKSRLIAVPEQSEFSPADAAKILGRKLKPLHEQVEAEIANNSPYHPDPPQDNALDHHKLFIRSDPYERSRWRYIFTDISATVSAQSRQVLVREPNGNLRHATPLERAIEGKRVWGEAKYKRYVA